MLAIMRGEMLYLRDSLGQAVITFTEFGDRSATYRWRARVAATGAEQQGSGRLVERMEPSPRADGSHWLDHGNSQTRVAAGPFSMAWSYRSEASAWLYVKADPSRASIMSATAFSTLSLYQ